MSGCRRVIYLSECVQEQGLDLRGGQGVLAAVGGVVRVRVRRGWGRRYYCSGHMGRQLAGRVAERAAAVDVTVFAHGGQREKGRVRRGFPRCGVLEGRAGGTNRGNPAQMQSAWYAATCAVNRRTMCSEEARVRARAGGRWTSCCRNPLLERRRCFVRPVGARGVRRPSARGDGGRIGVRQDRRWVDGVGRWMLESVSLAGGCGRRAGAGDLPYNIDLPRY